MITRRLLGQQERGSRVRVRCSGRGAETLTSAASGPAKKVSMFACTRGMCGVGPLCRRRPASGLDAEGRMKVRLRLGLRLRQVRAHKLDSRLRLQFYGSRPS